MALVAVNKEKGTRPTCSNCNCDGHSSDFCISPGGKMAGKMFEEAHDAQTAHRAAKKATHTANKAREANVATTGGAVTPALTSLPHHAHVATTHCVTTQCAVPYSNSQYYLLSGTRHAGDFQQNVTFIQPNDSPPVCYPVVAVLLGPTKPLTLGLLG
jgi:hypothetical protein